ncbi:c-type cytochrome [Psychrobacter aestuarii]|uniref:Cytochrome c n=1 Tax=Psychrobacter aestuarii TaxID=556327 RepID=A0ABN0VK57_9GAMM|nr:cytochrome c [Psychrobacter aestuarii]
MSLFNRTCGVKSAVTMALISAAVGLSACSQSASPDIKAREDIMKSWGDAMGVMGDMVKAPDTFDAAVFKEQAAFLADSADSPWTHFQDESAKGGAMDSVWSDADGFSSEADKFKQATDALNQAAQGASSVEDVQPAFAEVGASCKSCHTEYRAES